MGSRWALPFTLLLTCAVALSTWAGPRGGLEPAPRLSGPDLAFAEMQEAANEGFEALYWAFRYIQGREAWQADGPLIERYRPGCHRPERHR